MRSEKEMYDLFLSFAQQDERIRLVTLEGSRANPTVPDDGWKDYDISYFVTEIASFKESDGWLDYLGNRLILQKPEAMELYPPELGNWFSYLMLFEDGNKVDLTLIPLTETAKYFDKSDGLVKVLLDKDQHAGEVPAPTDQQYWIQKPSAKQYDDCCNEFWWVSTYVVKGLARNEFLFAADHLNNILRPALLQMMAWEIGVRKGYDFSLGKNYKFIEQHLPAAKWKELIQTFQMDGNRETWRALFQLQDLFRHYTNEVGRAFGFPDPNYDAQITPYIQRIFQLVNHPN